MIVTQCCSANFQRGAQPWFGIGFLVFIRQRLAQFTHYGSLVDTIAKSKHIICMHGLLETLFSGVEITTLKCNPSEQTQ